MVDWRDRTQQQQQTTPYGTMKTVVVPNAVMIPGILHSWWALENTTSSLQECEVTARGSTSQQHRSHDAAVKTTAGPGAVMSPGNYISSAVTQYHNPTPSRLEKVDEHEFTGSVRCFEATAEITVGSESCWRAGLSVLSIVRRSQLLHRYGLRIRRVRADLSRDTPRHVAV